MAASIGRVNFLTKRSNFFKYILIRTMPAVAASGTSSAKSLGLSVTQRENHSMASEAVNFYPTANVRFQSSAQTKDHVCWNCNNIHSSYVYLCDKCKTLQEPEDGRTHFEVMGVEQSFVIDTTSLTKKFRELQSQFHPDKFTKKTEKEQQLSEHHSSAVNKAYRILLKPIPRGHYLLELHGHSLEEGEIELDSEFLMEIMETNEAIFHANDLETLLGIDEKNKVVIDDLITQVTKCFDQGNIQMAKKTLAKLNYYTNIDDKIKGIQRQYMEYPIGR